MARVCHTNKCPVGVATQKEELRKRFKGLPENVVNFFLYIAEEIRQIMSSIGVSNMEELIGNQEFLTARDIQLPKTANIDLSSLIKKGTQNKDRSWLKHSKRAHTNGQVLEDQFLSDNEFMNTIKNHGKLIKEIEIKNTDRSAVSYTHLTLPTNREV